MIILFCLLIVQDLVASCYYNLFTTYKRWIYLLQFLEALVLMYFVKFNRKQFCSSLLSVSQVLSLQRYFKSVF